MTLYVPYGYVVPPTSHQGHMIVADTQKVYWSDPSTGSWDAADIRNEAGWWQAPWSLTGDVVVNRDGTVTVGGVNGDWLMIYVGQPFIYSFQAQK